MSPQALLRHKASHLPEALAQASQAAAEARGDDLIAEARALASEAKRLLAEATTAGNRDQALRCIDRLTRLLELRGKLVGQIGAPAPAPASDWSLIRSLVLAALRPHPEAAHAVVLALAQAPMLVANTTGQEVP